jgi:transposase
MDTEPLTLHGELFEPWLMSAGAGDEVLILYQGIPAYRFDRRDAIARDLVIAALLRLGVTQRTVARLTKMSPAHVCGVQRRVQRGGTEALLERRTGGNRSKLRGRRLERARVLRAQGASYATIAAALHTSESVVRRALRETAKPHPVVSQPCLLGIGQGPVVESVSSTTRPVIVETWTKQADTMEPIEPPNEIVEQVPPEEESTELAAGVALPAGPALHDCRYAGTLLMIAAVEVLGIPAALQAAGVARPKESLYDAQQVVVAVMAAWGAGYGSLEAMHERDARSLGVVLGLERSPSVRTLHRALGQMAASVDLVEWNVGLMSGVVAVASQLSEAPLLFGIDGHFTPYEGDAPIDKGWDSKRRLVRPGQGEIRVTDDAGFTWRTQLIPPGDALSQHLVSLARETQAVLDTERPVVCAFDRGGFAFEELGAVATHGLYYVGYVPATVTLGVELERVAPASDGVGEILWTHARLHHPARLLVQREGSANIPIVTNLPTLVPAEEVVRLLRCARGWQENSIKAARAFAHIDRRVDRGVDRTAPDDRLVNNPVRKEARTKLRNTQAQAAALQKEQPVRGERTAAQIESERLIVELQEAVLHAQLKDLPAKVQRMALDPTAKRAWLKTRNQALLGPLKNATDNARRWLLSVLGDALAPSDAPHDMTARTRTLLALLQAPGTVRVGVDGVEVMIDLPLPPTPHRRIAAALESLDPRDLRFLDGDRRIQFRLAPRPTRETLPSACTRMPK